MGKRKILKAKGPSSGLRTSRMVVQRKLQTGGVQLTYSESGMGAPVIMIHGLGASSRWWFPLFPELTTAHFRTLAPDLPGFGASPGPANSSIEGAARAVVAMADHLNLGEFFLCGHSMGGAVAAQIAADHGGRVRRLVLIDSAGIPDRVSARWVGRLLQPWSWCPPWFYTTLLGDLLRAGPTNMMTGIKALRRYDIRPTLQRIRVPSLLIWGEKDTLTPPRLGRIMAEALGDARLEIVPGVRHLSMVSKADIASNLVVNFFKEENR
jgi:pimeloyl-ACP methyl ester carboxylesterase